LNWLTCTGGKGGLAVTSAIVRGYTACIASAFELLRNTKGSHRGRCLVDKGLGESGGDSWGTHVTSKIDLPERVFKGAQRT